MLEFRILGPLEVGAGADVLALGGPKQRATLAILLLHANRVVSVDRLAEDLYAGAPPVTAVTQVQRQISDLRKVLGSSSLIETRPPGYLMRLEPNQLDLHRFERRAEQASHAVESGEAQRAVALYREALGLWRGAPLADLAFESFAQPAIGRLEEIRLAAVERRLDAELALGRHGELIGELEELSATHPLREHFRGQLMLALYRAGRQAKALEVYRDTRSALVEELGLEPGRTLQELERAILAQDPKLDVDSAPPASASSPADAERSVLALAQSDDRLDGLLATAEPLAALGGRELIVVRLVAHGDDLEHAASELDARRATLGVNARTAAFTSAEPGDDAVRLVNAYDVELLLVHAACNLDADRLPDELADVLARALADVGVLTGPAADFGRGGGVFVPFGGGEHDWGALELGARLASAGGMPLRLVGQKADPRTGRRDASRLLAHAGLAVQRVVGVTTQPLLAEPSEEALVAAVAPATIVVAGISPRWRQDGIGVSRRALIREPDRATLIVRRGPRPSGLAPEGSRTRFSWTIEA